jgi:probable phosphoglycerate mutase
MKMRERLLYGWLLGLMLMLVALPVYAGGGGEKTVTIYVTRHGRTLFNTKDLVQGWADSPLTPEGIAVAEDLGRGLRDVPFDYVVSSDLVRARQTAQIVMGQNRVSKGYRLEDSAMIREACYGHFEGDSNSTMLAAISAEIGVPRETMMQDTFIWLKAADAIKQIDTSGIGEDAATVKSRMQTKLTETAKAQAKKGGNILFVAHGQSINIMLSDLDPDFTYTGATLANAAVCKVIYQNGAFHIESFNDTSYIDAGKAVGSE